MQILGLMRTIRLEEAGDSEGAHRVFRANVSRITGISEDRLEAMLNGSES